MASKRKRDDAEPPNLMPANSSPFSANIAAAATTQDGRPIPAAKRFRNANFSPSSSSTSAPSIFQTLPPQVNIASPSSSSNDPGRRNNDVLPMPGGASAMADITNQIDNGLRNKRKRGRPATWDEATPRHKQARASLYGILGESGMLPAGQPPEASGLSLPSSGTPPALILNSNGVVEEPGAIVIYNEDAHALVCGSNNPMHLERLSQVMASPELIGGLYKEFCSRLAKPVDITEAWVYFVSELSSYAYAQARRAGRTDISYEQVESFIKTNWFTITAANSKALANKSYEEVFPATSSGAIVLSSPHPDRAANNQSFGFNSSFNADTSVRTNLNGAFGSSNTLNVPGGSGANDHENAPPGPNIDTDMDVDM